MTPIDASSLQVFRFDSVDSTNEAAKRLIHEGKLTGRGYVLAREQTAGRGQRGRSWSSPRDAGIFLSVVDRPERAASDLTLYTLAAGVACVEAIRDVTGLNVQLKPVNDLYAEGCKLGGILTEAVIEQGRMQALITGIGINLRRTEHGLTDSRATPISLQELLPVSAFGYLDAQGLARSVVRGALDWNAMAAEDAGRAVRVAWGRYRMDDGAAQNESGA